MSTFLTKAVTQVVENDYNKQVFNLLLIKLLLNYF